MTVSINSDASEIYFTDSVLSTSNLDLGLSTYYNCATTPTSTALLSRIASISSNKLTLRLIDFYGGSTTNTKFADGVYNFQLTVKYMSSGNLVTRLFKMCFIVDYDLKCLYLKYQQDNNDAYLEKQYKTISYGNDCDDCNCTNLCVLYNDMLSTITSTNTSTNASNCGC